VHGAPWSSPWNRASKGNLVGSDEKTIHGETTFRWLPGSFFLAQYVQLNYAPPPAPPRPSVQRFDQVRARQLRSLSRIAICLAS
jgi:hypothetical protein